MRPLRPLRPPGRPHSSRFALGATIAVLLATIAGFSWIAVQSYQLIHTDEAPLGQSSLRPVELVGPQETVFDWSRQACNERDIPDQPARAYRDAGGQVRLFATQNVNRTMNGPSLNRVKRDCRIVMGSEAAPLPQTFADREWISSPYTLDGKTVYALVHDEYHGYAHEAGRCVSNFPRCWYNAVTLVASTDRGASFRHTAPPPANLVAEVPYRYKPDLPPYGVFNPSNIVEKDDYYYTLVVVNAYRAQKAGTCVMRTGNLADPRSWRAWNGDSFDVTFVDPYRVRDAAAGDHFCEPVSRNQIGSMSSSLTYNSYFGKYVLVGATGSFDARKRRVVNGFYYSLSDDLVSWSERKLIREVELPWTYRCGDPDPVIYPSLLDPTSSSRNFDTTGREPYLYFTREHWSACRQTFDRDLMRVRIRFSK
jgi:hypothetical protein